MSAHSAKSFFREVIAATCFLPYAGPCFAELLNSTQITASIAEARERVQAIVKASEDDKRDLTDEEQSEVDEILGTGTPGADGFKPGKIAKLEKQLARAKQIEANQASLALERVTARNSNPGGDPSNSGGNTDPNLNTPNTSCIIVPARCITGRPLTAFSGPTAQVQAYVAGQFYLASLFGFQKSIDFCKQHGIGLVKAAQSGGVDGKGGFLVPTELANTIIQLAYTYGVVMANADLQDMISDTKDIVKETGDPEASWMAATGAGSERTTVPELDFDYANIRLVANKMGALTRLSSEITEDSIIAIADNITVRLARAMAKRMDRTGFLGIGDATSGGFTGILPALAAGSIFTPAVGVDTYAEFTKAHFDAIIGMIDERADDDKCAFYINKVFYTSAMCPIMEAMGGNNSIDLSDGIARRKRMFLGYPVTFCSIFPRSRGTLATLWLGGFGDLEKSLIAGVRREVQIAVSTEAGFLTDEILLRALFRGAIQTNEVGDSTNAGCFVGIKAAAAV